VGGAPHGGAARRGRTGSGSHGGAVALTCTVWPTCSPSMPRRPSFGRPAAPSSTLQAPTSSRCASSCSRSSSCRSFCPSGVSRNCGTRIISTAGAAARGGGRTWHGGGAREGHTHLLRPAGLRGAHCVVEHEWWLIHRLIHRARGASGAAGVPAAMGVATCTGKARRCCGEAFAPASDRAESAVRCGSSTSRSRTTCSWPVAFTHSVCGGGGGERAGECATRWGSGTYINLRVDEAGEEVIRLLLRGWLCRCCCRCRRHRRRRRRRRRFTPLAAVVLLQLPRRPLLRLGVVRLPLLQLHTHRAGMARSATGQLEQQGRQGRHPLEGLDVHVQLLCDFLGVGLPLHLSPRHLVQQSLGRAAPHAWRSYGGQAHAISSRRIWQI
jgi:hypothetical protein